MTRWHTVVAPQLIALLLFGSCALASAAEQRLHLTWPDHWEYRPAVQRGHVLYLQARQQINGETFQRLSITAIDAQAAQKPITVSALRELCVKLRDALLPTAVEADIPIESFAHRQGHYFIVTGERDRPEETDDFRQLAEGVILHSGYLINFTLLTNDAQGAAAMEIVRALDQVRIE